MSGYDPISRQAFERVDITAQQARVLAAFQPGAQHTRQELVTLTGMPINCVTGRVHELLKAGKLESLPAVNGRHPLRLTINAAGRPKQALALEANRPAGTFVNVPPLPDVDPAAPLTAITPFLGGRPSLSIESAKVIVKDKSNAFFEEARRVVQSGEYRVWN